MTDRPRDVPDDVLSLLSDRDGVVMANFYPTFVSRAYFEWNAARAGEEARQKTLFPADPDKAAAALKSWVEAHPAPVVTVSDVADHIEHVVSIAGVDHVGLGADFERDRGRASGPGGRR